ncbi:MAG: DNA polymerase III subunit delta [Proteobacteria bacterium]|nr:DNA polymerase III subunit delta [Pseudomonadota bacterium]MDE3208176.1 DNA polymerase III subunit delta [Pseudomonadota bacterium]
MRIRLEHLVQVLQNQQVPIFLVFGDEILVVLETRDLIRRHAISKGYTERVILDVDAGFDWNRLEEAGSHLSLFGAKQLVELNLPSGKPGLPGAKALLEWAENPPQDVLLLVLLPHLDKATQQSKWFTKLEGSGACIQVNAVTHLQLPNWISDRLSAQKQQADRATLMFLADMTEGNLLAAWQEIQKFGLLYPSGRLEYEKIRQSVLSTARYAPFDLVESVLGGDRLRTVRILDGLEQEGCEPAVVLWALAREVRILMSLIRQLRKGVPMKSALQGLKVWSSRALLVERATLRISPYALSQALHCFASLDRQIKGVGIKQVWQDLAQVCFLLCDGKHANSKRAAI